MGGVKLVDSVFNYVSGKLVNDQFVTEKLKSNISDYKRIISDILGGETIPTPQVKFDARDLSKLKKYLQKALENEKIEEETIAKVMEGLDSKVMKSIYERIGGEEILSKIVEGFFKSLVADPLLQAFFKSVSIPTLKEKFQKYLVAGFGGPNHYIWKDLKTAHMSLAIQETHFNAFAKHFITQLSINKVDAGVQAEINSIIQQLKEDIIDERSKSNRTQKTEQS